MDYGYIMHICIHRLSVQLPLPTDKTFMNS